LSGGGLQASPNATAIKESGILTAAPPPQAFPTLSLSPYSTLKPIRTIYEM